MAILKQKEVEKMSLKEKLAKLSELKLELVRANVTANRTNAKTKEIKKAISRLLTSMKTEKQGKFNKSSGKKSEKELKT